VGKLTKAAYRTPEVLLFLFLLPCSCRLHCGICLPASPGVSCACSMHTCVLGRTMGHWCRGVYTICKSPPGVALEGGTLHPEVQLPRLAAVTDKNISGVDSRQRVQVCMQAFQRDSPAHPENSLLLPCLHSLVVSLCLLPLASQFSS